jgi:hypothetical protein
MRINVNAWTILKLAGLVASFLISAPAHASTLRAASVRSTDVQAQIDLANDGDTVIVPAGTMVWRTGLNVRKNITVRGSGIGQTIIIDEVPRTPGSHAINVALSKDLPFRLTGFEIRGSPTVTAYDEEGVVHLQGRAGVTRRFRLDHCKFSDLHGVPVRCKDLIGVVDHCAIEALDTTSIQVFHATWGGADFGHGSWADYPYWGSDKFLFIEDCTFNNSNPKKAGVDCYDGARLVVRHCTFNDAQVTAHGTEASGRGAKQLEIYDNVFTTSVRRRVAQLRSGSVVVHDNIYKNFTNGMELRAYRQFVTKGSWGISSGSNVWDVNNSVLGPLERGTHTGSNQARTLFDSSKSWMPNHWETVESRKGFTYVIRNITQHLQSVITSNTKTAVSYFQYSPPMTFDRGDKYEIWKVITTLDQPGQGKSNLLSGLPAEPKRWPHNILEPCYSWNNKDESGNELDLGSIEGSIEEGRDFYNRIRKPNYAPYVYPHPLAATN